jgi:hypothetical protein
MGMNEVGRYREYAANCLNIAQNTADPNAKLTLLDMAQVWIVLAEEAERNGGLRLNPMTRKSSTRPGNPPPT